MYWSVCHGAVNWCVTLLVLNAGVCLQTQVRAQSAEDSRTSYPVGYVEVPQAPLEAKHWRHIRPAVGQQVQLQCEYWELDLDRIRQLGGDIQQLEVDGEEGPKPRVTTPPDVVAKRKVIAALAEQQLAKSLGGPTLIATVKRPVRFRHGNEVAMDAGQRVRLGIDVWSLPQILATGELQLELKASHTTLAASKGGSGENRDARQVQKCQLASTVVLKDGGTCVLLSSDESDDRPHRRLLVLVSAMTLPEPAQHR